MKKKIIVDIGTHKFEEINLLFFKDFLYLYFYLNWWKNSLKIFFFKLFSIKDISINQTGSLKSALDFDVRLHYSIIKLAFFHKRNINDYLILAIDPNYPLCLKYVKKFYNLKNFIYLPHAINCNEDLTNISPIIKFYKAKNTLSYSIFKTDFTNDFEYSPSASLIAILNTLDKDNFLSLKNDEFIIRLNCEGAEYNIINELINSNLKIKMICGSLNDIQKKYSTEHYNFILKKIAEKKINYFSFKGSDPSTWLNLVNFK